MNKYLKNELLYGSRALLRDNWLSRQLLGSMRRHESMSMDEIASLRLKYLHQTLQCAMAKLPYYAHIEKDFSVDQSADMLQKHFPIIDNTSLLENRTRLYPNRGVARPWHAVGKTSGTTGTPISMFRGLQSVLLESAFVKRQWEWNGYRDGMRRASLRGDVVVNLSRTEPPFWFWNRYNNQLLISSRHLKDDYMDAIADKLVQFAPKMLQTYPSTAYTLAHFLERRGRYLEIPFVFTGSEPLYPHQRELIEARLGCKVRDLYGMAERVAFATECEFGEMHINPDYSYVEIVDDKGHPTDGYGHVVGTTFHNSAMPLVRYKLSDRTRWKTGACRCGRAFPMIEPVSGKFEDRIYGSDGAVVSPSVLTFAFKGVDNILKSQVAQIAPARWEIRLVPAAAFSEVNKQKLINNIRELVDAKVAVQVVLKSDIQNTSSGKFRWVVNESPKDEM